MQLLPARNFTDSSKKKVRPFCSCNFGADFDNQIRNAVLCKCRTDYVKRKLLEEREELTLARTLEIAEQCESVDHHMSHLSVREPSKAMQTGFTKHPSDPMVNKSERKMAFGAIVVD